MYPDWIDNSFFDKSFGRFQADYVIPTYIRIFQVNILKTTNNTQDT